MGDEMSVFEELGEAKAIQLAEDEGIVLHNFVDPIDGYQDVMIIRRNTEINSFPNIFELFIESSTGGYLRCPKLNTDEMDEFLEGTGLNQDQLAELCDGFDLW